MGYSLVLSASCITCMVETPWIHTMDPQWVETIIVGWIAIVYRIMEYNREGGLIFVIDGLD